MSSLPFIAQWYWREPLWLMLALIPIIVIGWRSYKQRNALRRYADTHLHDWVKVQTRDHHYQNILQAIFLITAWIFLAIAVAGPRLLLQAPDNILPGQGAVMIVMDNSRSMQASDVYPHRRQLAINHIQKWFSHTYHFEIGLQVYAGGAHVLIPPTSDQNALNEISQLLPDLRMPSYGSALNEALHQSYRELEKYEGDKAILVITDGDNDHWSEIKATLSNQSNTDTTVHFLGIGTPSPVTLKDHRGQWLLYEGQPVTTYLNDTELKDAALIDQVFYQRLNTSKHKTITDIWQPAIQRISADHQQQILWQELFPWFLLAGLLLLIVPAIEWRSGIAMVFIVLVFMPFAIVLQSQQLQANNNDSNLSAAYSAWSYGNYAQAASLYQKIPGYEARMGEGASCFREDDVSCAIQAYQQAAWQAHTDEERGTAAYNLGNSYFREGDFPAAMTAFKDALRYQPLNTNYQNNLEFTQEVQARIELRLQQETASLAKRLARGEKKRDFDGDINPDTPLTLGEKISSNDFPELTDEVLLQYLQRYKAQASLKSDNRTGSDKRQHDRNRFSNNDPITANRIAFWQKLIELEENITVSPKEPRILPGVRPW